MSNAPPLRLTFVTIGVDDLARSIRFYEAMGLQRRMKQAEGVAFFDAGGVVVSLFPREELAKDANVENSKPGFSGIALAYNVASEPEVDLVLNAAKAAGGKVFKGRATRVLGRLVRSFRRSRRPYLGSRALSAGGVRRPRAHDFARLRPAIPNSR